MIPSTSKCRIVALLLMVCLWQAACSLYAQSSELYYNFTIADGLASTSVYCAFQDSKGYLWFGTSAGVSRFDGKEFVNYGQADGMSSPFVYRMAEDRKGRIWMMSGSLTPFYFYKGKWYNEDNDPDLTVSCENSFVLDFAEMSEEEFYFGCMGANLLNIHKGVSSNKINLQLRAPLRIFDIQPQSDHQLLIISSLYIMCYNTKNQQLDWKVEIPHTHRIRYVGPDKIVGATESNGFVFSIKERKIVSTYSSPKADATIFIGSQEEEGVVIGTREGLYHLTDKGFQLHPLHQYLEGLAVSWYMKDEDGGIWITTIESGVFYFPKSHVKRLPISADIEGSACVLKQLPDKSLFIGSELGKYFIHKDGKTRSRSFPEGWIKTRILNVFQPSDAPEEQWIFSQSTLLGQIGSQQRQFAQVCRDVIYDSVSQAFYLTHLRGLHYLDRNTMREAVLEKERNSSFDRRLVLEVLVEEGNFSDLELDEKRKLWFGGIDGLLCFDLVKSTLTNYTDSFPELSTSLIRNICSLDDQRVAVASYGNGVLIFDHQSGEHFWIDDQDGLIDNHCLKIFKDDNNSLWVSSIKGLSHLRLLPNQQCQIDNFGPNDGIPPSTIHNITSIDGQIYLSSVQGLYSFGPKDILQDRIHPKINHISLAYGEQVLDPHSSFRLQHQKRQKPLTFSYNSICFPYGRQMEYRYRLAGYEEEWVSSTAEQVTYNGLPPGQYTFELFAQHPLGIESEVVRIPFELRLPFYRQFWFRLAIILLALGLIWRLFGSGILSFDRVHFSELIRRLLGIAPAPPLLTIKTSDGVFEKIRSDEIYAIKAAGNYVRFYTAKGLLLSRNTLKEVEAELEKITDIQRVHRSYLVNLSNIEAILPDGAIRINELIIPVSSSYQDKIKGLKHKLHAS
ncbi:MAG: two-component regulator propeller domain-containing protein [Bacteroidota bacterium]